MELNGDGHLDILSGSYSRHERDMAGLFQVLWGKEDGSFRPPEPLKGSDGELLIITSSGGEDATIEKICTRPTAVDLDGDGKLDIVSGNFGGTFAWFRGDGDGKFAPTSTWLRARGKDDAEGEPLRVPHHSDPFFVDWDGDGDLDMLSGSSNGGAFLFENRGSKTSAAFGEPTTLHAVREHRSGEVQLGEAHLQGPQGSTRIWADDVDGDGKLDLLLGDSVRLVFAAEGVDEATAKRELARCETEQQALYATLPAGDAQPSEAAMKKFQQAMEELEAERSKYVRDESTGFVWLLRQK